MTDAEPGADDPFDPATLLADLERARQRKLKAVALRPTALELSDALRQACDDLYELIEGSRRLAAREAQEDPRETYAWFPREGSIGFEDRKFVEAGVLGYLNAVAPTEDLWLDTNPTRNTSAWAVEFLRRCLYSVIDDLGAVALLVLSGDHIRAPITLCRSVLEAAAVGCFLMDAEATREERLRRSLNLRLSELQEASNEVYSDSGDFEYESDMEELIRYAQTIRFDVTNRKRAKHQPPILGEVGTTRPDSARGMVDALLPDGLGLSMWRSLSAVAHVRDSGTLLPDEYSLPHEVEGWRSAEAVAWHTVPALLVVHELASRVQRFLGWDLGAWVNSFEEQTIGLWARGAGMYDSPRTT